MVSNDRKMTREGKASSANFSITTAFFKKSTRTYISDSFDELLMSE